MRFKSHFRKDTLSIFLNVLSAMARFSKAGKPNSVRSFLKLSSEKIQLNVRNVDLVEAYAEFDTKDIFHEDFLIESKRQNMIGLAIPMQNFHDALKSGLNCEKITVRLSKRQGQGVLSFEFNDPLMENLSVTQDCPVQPLMGDSFNDATLPEIPACEWNIELPPAKHLLNVLLQMQKLGNETIEFLLKRSNKIINLCELQISSDSEIVSVKSRYTNCHLFAQESISEETQLIRSFKLKRVVNALKVGGETLLSRANDGFSLLGNVNIGGRRLRHSCKRRITALDLHNFYFKFVSF
ncbi:hypothetical protein IE077_000343 [Cardiosporidium cionae]|uniref:Checkpoint protein n=1 Tax=Cardiosporidium cionae TaxID=476202 RepID=A0ABQ7JAX8_9APIC|nr:hypothetical protein IE077_000343 [Cardiosporidium cionae]|eukprot:KAF8821139.1 hypothetical protein IE077_000343 [Cardiosporidium cionae]